MSEQAANEEIGAPILDDPAWESARKFLDGHCHPHTEALSDCFRCNWLYFRNVSIQHIISLQRQLADECQRHEDRIRQCERLEKELAALRART